MDGFGSFTHRLHGPGDTGGIVSALLFTLSGSSVFPFSGRAPSSPLTSATAMGARGSPRMRELSTTQSDRTRTAPRACPNRRRSSCSVWRLPSEPISSDRCDCRRQLAFNTGPASRLVENESSVFLRGSSGFCPSVWPAVSVSAVPARVSQVDASLGTSIPGSRAAAPLRAGS
jgi:hypothetical protein